MDIGGSDLIIKTECAGVAMHFVIRALLADWPDAYIDYIGPWPASRLADAFPIKEAEAFIYKDLQAFVSWESEGLTDDNTDLMVHLLPSLQSLTVVMSSRTSKTSRLVINAAKALLHNFRSTGYYWAGDAY